MTGRKESGPAASNPKLRTANLFSVDEAPQVTRRSFLQWLAGLSAAAVGGYGIIQFTKTALRKPLDKLLVNDMHSQLNQASIAKLHEPTSLEELCGIVKQARRAKEPLAICGSRHAMGGQQFLKGGNLIDTRGMTSIIDFDAEKGLIEVEAGIEWPELVEYLLKSQEGKEKVWTISSKQTGADKLTLGGALSANAHGRCLDRKPMISDIESFLLVDHEGDIRKCSRTENQELFSLAIGGYGLFGVIHSVVLRLVPRQKIRRDVKVTAIADLAKDFVERIADGYTLGDFQFATDEKSPDFLQRGVFSCYRPVDESTDIPSNQDSVSDRAWEELVFLAHTDKARAFQLYSDFYVKSSGQIYWSDTSQIGSYPFDYHLKVDQRMGAETPATEMITEIYVPRDRLADFMTDAARMLQKQGTSVIYGTIRLIEKDDESFLAWAKDRYACVIFNLCVVHTDEKIEQAAEAFRSLIYLAIARKGSYYLTYHRWANKDQVLACYPQFPEFLKLKRKYDPDEVFQSDWYRHYRAMFA